MSYNSKLEQTGRRVASARRKYYGSFDYGSGLNARLRGGSFSFGRKHAWGGPDGKTWVPEIDETEVDEPDLQTLIAEYFRKHPNDAYKFNKNPETGLDYGAEFGDTSFGNTNWIGLATIGVDMLGSGVQNFSSMQDKRNALSRKYDLFGTSEFNGLTYNNALLSTMANTQMLSGASAKDFRDKTVGQDVMSVLGAGVSGAKYGGIYGALGAMALKGVQIGGERWNAKRLADDASMEAKRKNRQFLKDMSVASTDVDSRNDWLRSMGYYNDPYLAAFGGPLHSSGGDYNGKLTYIDAGGRHEQNPYEGVLSGLDENGNPNLVEEGEVIWNNDYVFSDRIHIPKRLADKYRLGGKKITFADAIEKVTKENSISPTDPVTIATTKEIVNEFMDEQEAIREQRQLAAKEELEAAQADDFLAQLDAAQGIAPPMGAPIDMGQMSMGMPNEAPVTEGEMMPPGYAFGGNKFEGGGWEDFFKMLEEYRGSLGESNLAGRYAIDRNAKYWNNSSAVDIQKGADYQAFTKWVKEHKDDPNVQRYFEYLDKGINKSKGAKTLLKYDKDGKAIGLADGWEPTFEHRRTDDALGIYHLNPADLGFLFPKAAKVTVPDVKLSDFDFNIPFDLETYLGNSDIKSDIKDGARTTTASPEFKYYDTSMRDAPIYGAFEDYLERRFGQPDYSNANAIIAAASRLGIPINIPVETIGDYRKRNPYDERYLVNMANQNRAAAQRAISDTAGGNRSMDLLGAMSLAHSSQTYLGEIMRQAYLANRQDDATVAEFNRGTNLYNMNAINQRNLSQAQLNTQREQAGFSGLAHGYGLKQTIHDNWDDAAMESYNSFLASLGAKGKENEEYNILTSMAEQGYFPHYYRDRGIIDFVRPSKNGGKLNRKKRRF